MSPFPKSLRGALSAAILLGLSGVALAQSSYVIKDGQGVAQTVKSVNCGGTICPLMVPFDSSGVAFGTSGNPFRVSFSSAQAVTGTFWPYALGQTTMSASVPVAFANNQSALSVIGTFWQGTQPVSAAVLPLPTGAATSAKQPALGTAGAASTDVVTVQGIASMVPFAVTGTFWQATQPISAASLPLPSGAATSAKQAALGTAGTPAADVYTVQGAASMTALKVDGSATTQPISGIDGALVSMGAKADSACGTDTGTCSEISLIKRGLQTLTTINTNIVATGTVQGTAASGSSVSGNPVLVGGRAQNAEATPVSNGQAVAAARDLVGKAIVLPYANPENLESGVPAAITDNSSHAIMAAAGAGVRHYVTDCLVTNQHATVGTVVTILDGASAIDQGYAAPAGGGFTHTYPAPRRGTANTALNAQATTTGANILVSCGGYKGS